MIIALFLQSLNLLEQNLKKELVNLEEQLKSRKEKRFYICKTCSIEVSEETALLNNFVCPECEEVYELANNQDIIKQLEKNISKIKKEIELVSVERKIEEEKLEKKKVGKIKRAERKMEEAKIKERRRKRKINQKEGGKSGKNKKAEKKFKKFKKSSKKIKSKRR